ncbi:unnamed protein product [Brachionus calyciflorus]|uniref:C-type lectin domain-containing protein n=1 Tax=Brachionus calyciflorus TaxID=104777 RepID=A0A814IBT3_9BILA|nr:unnamed protein product [Brachionus calyciflorus]
MCQDYAFIYCIGGTCLCDSSRYYDTTYLACLPRSSHNQKCSSDLHCMTSASTYQLTCKSNTCQCRNYDTDWLTGDQVYWSTSLQICRLCPTGYKTGYGAGIFGSPNRITNRCYGVETNEIYNFNSAQDQCFNTDGNQANLITIRNVMEVAIIKTQVLNGLGAINFLTGSITTTYLSFKWNYNNNVDVQNTLWCNNQPNNAGGNQNALILIGGYCFNDLVDNNVYGFICEKG